MPSTELSSSIRKEWLVIDGHFFIISTGEATILKEVWHFNLFEIWIHLKLFFPCWECSHASRLIEEALVKHSLRACRLRSLSDSTKRSHRSRKGRSQCCGFLSSAKGKTAQTWPGREQFFRKHRGLLHVRVCFSCLKRTWKKNLLLRPASST